LKALQAFLLVQPTDGANYARQQGVAHFKRAVSGLNNLRGKGVRVAKLSIGLSNR
jgi:hypothetical protein